MDHLGSSEYRHARAHEHGHDDAAEGRRHARRDARERAWSHVWSRHGAHLGALHVDERAALLGAVRRMLWTSALGEWNDALRAAGRAATTVRLYMHYLGRLAVVTDHPFQVTVVDLRRVMAGEVWAPETRKAARTAYRSFFRWAHAMGYHDHDPSAALEPVRALPPTPRPAPELVVRRIIAHEDPRIAFMARLAAFAGLRASEIAQVHSSDLMGDLLRVHGKGGKTRVVPILDDVLYGLLDDLDGYAFPSLDAAGTARDHLTAGTVTKMLSAALPDGWTAHTLRHRMATTAYAGSRDLLAVGRLLGHARPETTQRYVALSDEALREAMRSVVA